MWRIVVWSCFFSLPLALSSCGMFKRNADSCGYDIKHEVSKTNATKIYYAATDELYNSISGAKEQIPCTLLTKIKKSFELWESVEEANLEFEYVGVGDSRSTFSNFSPLIFVDVKGDEYDFTNAGTTAGVGTTVGTAGGADYQGGNVWINVKANTAGLGFKTITHELGHALGVGHTAQNGSLMSCGTPAWGEFDVLALNEQDRADLAKIWSPNNVYTISGQVGGTAGDAYYVYAANTKNGLSYSALSDVSGYYTLSIPKAAIDGTVTPATFKIFAKSYEATAWDLENVEILPSWRIDNSSSSNNPDAASVITVSDANANQTDIDISLVSASVSPLFWGQTYKLFQRSFPNETLFDSIHSFLAPSQSCKFYFTYLSETPSAVRAFGSDPDYSFSSLGPAQNYESGSTIANSFEITVSIAEGAPNGDRLILMDFEGHSYVQAALVGLHVSDGKKPSDAGFNTVDTQISEGWDMTGYDGFYWQKSE